MVPQPCDRGTDRPGARPHETKVSRSECRYFKSSTRLSDNTATFRDRLQVLKDLATALHFSPQSLESNRKGKLSGEQFARLIGNFATPFFMTLLFAAAPFVGWGVVTAGQQQASFPAGVQLFLGQLMHIGDLADSQGTFAVI